MRLRSCAFCVCGGLCVGGVAMGCHDSLCDQLRAPKGPGVPRRACARGRRAPCIHAFAGDRRRRPTRGCVGRQALVAAGWGRPFIARCRPKWARAVRRLVVGGWGGTRQTRCTAMQGGLIDWCVQAGGTDRRMPRQVHGVFGARCKCATYLPMCSWAASKLTAWRLLLRLDAERSSSAAPAQELLPSRVRYPSHNVHLGSARPAAPPPPTAVAHESCCTE